MMDMLTQTHAQPAGAGCRMIRQIVRTGVCFFLAGAWLLAGFGSTKVWAQGMTLDICPTDYGNFPEDAPTLTCGCDAASVRQGSVYGANPYPSVSSLCRAALHAGAIGAEGGQIVVQPKKAAFYPAVTRNGVEARSWGADKGFSVSAKADGRSGSPVFDAANRAGLTLDICPTDYGNFPEDAPTLTCGCGAASVRQGSVYGANPYPSVSSLCRAALHAGAIGPEGGQIVVQPKKAAFYPAVTRNDVAARSWGADKGFQVVIAGRPATPSPAAAGAASAGAPAQTAGMTLDICPTDYGNFPEDAPTLTCGCDAASVRQGSVYGANPYPSVSSLCRAALHAGAIGPAGGQIVVQPKKAAFYPAVTRNDVAARSWGADKGFQVVIAGKPATPSPAAAGSAGAGAPAQTAGMMLDICPTDYGNFPEDAPTLTCGCDAASVKQGSVYGANPYPSVSSLCRAALHAGAIGAEGGQIVVQPKKAAFYPAVTRNGVAARSWGEDKGFSVSAVPGAAPVATASRPAVDLTGKPIQAPIAATLRETGKVQLYINFATDQDKPLPSSEPVLQELLATLKGDGALRVILIGHTDNQGSGPYNLDLSQRRAAAVYLWLIQHGMASGRLRSDGRGLMEPIADNATEWGRALNRRVEVKANN
jgi:outer membrane protein OmpA-like peptidoglycan-associated protein/protein tyrosine phosphatase (PTP) superfamily phosphohydrolase (DUF442 family)